MFPLKLDPHEIQEIIEEIESKKYRTICAEMKDRSIKGTFDRHCRKAICTSLSEIFKILESEY